MALAHITYKPVEADWNGASRLVPLLEVYLDGAFAGTIFRRTGSGFFYQPWGTDTTSKVYPSLDELKASLEGKE
jgi:hypothetical protein